MKSIAKLDKAVKDYFVDRLTIVVAHGSLNIKKVFGFKIGPKFVQIFNHERVTFIQAGVRYLRVYCISKDKTFPRLLLWRHTYEQPRKTKQFNYTLSYRLVPFNTQDWYFLRCTLADHVKTKFCWWTDFCLIQSPTTDLTNFVW